MVELTLNRSEVESGPGFTHGRLFIDECGFFCWTLEDEDRGLTQDMPLEKIKAIKVYGKTAIPKGRYRIELRVSPKFKDRPWAKPFGGLIPYILDVPGYDGVAIHVGTTVDNTLGCPLVGMVQGNKRGRLYDSTKAFKDLMDFYLMPAHKRKDQMWITIK
ncbi:MAG: hypothetical protein J6Y20_04715 [Lachnospiraceae bacterium]|nr:hypothetical protein [Kiritimatiellia bacterium]MBP5461408.1 hypothetical protein [Lachnospiraceae bacterium]